MSDILDELQWRGLVAQTTDESALRTALADGPITAYCGFDPTAPSLHFGNLVQLVVLRHLQRAGHRVICLVGGSTGLIGDPRPTAERVLKTKEQTAEWVARHPAARSSRSSTSTATTRAVFVNNLDWTAPMSALDFLRDVGKHFRVNQMVRKEADRRAAEQRRGHLLHRVQLPAAAGARLPASSTATYGCTLQTGGNDQWGNLTAGVGPDPPGRGRVGAPAHDAADHRRVGREVRQVARATPSGCRADMTSPYAFYQYWLNVEDASVRHAAQGLHRPHAARRSPSSSARWREEPFRRAAQTHPRRRRHDAGARRRRDGRGAGRLRGAVRQGRPARRSTPRTLGDATAELPGGEVHVGTSVVDALVAVGLVDSRNAARRAIGDGGASVNGAKVTDPERVLGAEDVLHGRVVVLRRGRKSLAAGRLPDAG